jgi:hypothetical protein
VFSALGHLFNNGPRMQLEKPDPVLLAKLDERRRELYHQRFLEQLLASSPRPDVVGNIDEIRRSIEALSEEPQTSLRSAPLIAKIFARSGDSELRLSCLRALQHLNMEQARNELRRLSQDPGTGEGWRELCIQYLNADLGPDLAGAPGGQ